MEYLKKHKTTIIFIGILIFIILTTIFQINDSSNTEEFPKNGPFIPFYNPSTDSNSTTTNPNKSLKIYNAPSFECLACHDGSSASSKGHWQPSVSEEETDHPIGVYYDPYKSGYNAIPDSFLEGGFVGCTTCHTKHELDGKSTLRISNTNSELCFLCHNK